MNGHILPAGAIRLVLLIAGLMLASVTRAADEGPYDADADASADIAAALDAAASSDRLVFVMFGANWCPDCRNFARLLAENEVAPMVEEEFVVAKVDVGDFDRNLDVSDRFGNPIENGIPAAVFLDTAGNVIAATRMGELASARSFQPDDVVDFLKSILARGT